MTSEDNRTPAEKALDLCQAEAGRRMTHVRQIATAQGFVRISIATQDLQSVATKLRDDHYKDGDDLDELVTKIRRTGLP